MLLRRSICFWLILIFSYSSIGECSCFQQQNSLVCCPTYSGGFYGGGAWLYLESFPTDGDFEYGSFLTLTDSPANLNALLLEVDPGYKNALSAHFGYQIPCTNQDLSFNYLYFSSTDSDKRSLATENQLIQNFLGASYSTSKAKAIETIHQVDLQYSHHFLIDDCLDLNPYINVGYVGIWRDFDVNFEDLVLNPNPSSLEGDERSKYWGFGPFLGSKFSFPLFQCFSLKGNVGGGLFFGRLTSKVDSTSVRNEGIETFSANDSTERVVTNLKADVALAFSYPVFQNCWDFKLEVGYRVDYFFKGINRINPFNGFVNNPNTFPVNQSSNLGLGGPYIEVSLSPGLLSCNPQCCCDWGCSGPSFRFISAWLEPCPTGDDLTFAILQTTQGNQKGLEVNPNTEWTGTYELSYRFSSSADIRGRYFHLNTKDTKTFHAGMDESIASLNSSGPTFIAFSTATSKIKYEIDEYDISLGKWVELFCRLDFRGFFGVQYSDLKRTQENEFLGGEPPLTTREKFPDLKSRFCGIGPFFGIEPSISLFWHLSITGIFDLAFLVGELKATLDQTNNGLLGESSNTLRTPKTDFIVPKINTRAGIKFDYTCSCFGIEVEGGYQYSEYYRGVNLLFPTLLTGLEQNNTNLKLLGPYLSVSICSSF